METVRVLSNFRVEIPESIRERLELTVGQQLQMFVYGGRIELIPIRPIKQMRGFLKGIDTTVKRGGDRA